MILYTITMAKFECLMCEFYELVTEPDGLGASRMRELKRAWVTFSAGSWETIEAHEANPKRLDRDFHDVCPKCAATYSPRDLTASKPER